MRIGGMAGKVMEKLGVVPQLLPGGDIYPALEKGTVDAAEWVGPYDDEKLGFNKIAKYYYYPGWWEGGPQLDAYFNLNECNKLPKEYQNILEAACWEANTWMVAKYDAQNPAALEAPVAGGTQLRAFSKEIMVASYKASLQVYDELSQKSPRVQEDLRVDGQVPRRTSCCGSAWPRRATTTSCTRSRTSSTASGTKKSPPRSGGLFPSRRRGRYLPPPSCFCRSSAALSSSLLPLPSGAGCRCGAAEVLHEIAGFARSRVAVARDLDLHLVDVDHRLARLVDQRHLRECDEQRPP